MAARRNKDGKALSLFADVLKEARHKAGLSSDDLGAKLGYSGALIRALTEIRVQAGTLFGGTTWVYSGVTTGTVNTTSMTFLPRQTLVPQTLVSGNAPIINTVPLSSAGNCFIQVAAVNQISQNATMAFRINSFTTGALNTAVMSVSAYNEAGLVAPNDNSMILVSITNKV